MIDLEDYQFEVRLGYHRSLDDARTWLREHGIFAIYVAPALPARGAGMNRANWHDRVFKFKDRKQAIFFALVWK